MLFQCFTNTRKRLPDPADDAAAVFFLPPPGGAGSHLRFRVTPEFCSTFLLSEVLLCRRVWFPDSVVFLLQSHSKALSCVTKGK